MIFFNEYVLCLSFKMWIPQSTNQKQIHILKEDQEKYQHLDNVSIFWYVCVPTQ